MNVIKLLGSFFKAISGDWLALMSGPPTVPLAIASYYVSNHSLKVLFGCLAILCGFVSSFRIWAKEHRKYEDEVTKQGRPVLVAAFQILGGDPPQTMLRLVNSSE